MKKIGPDSGNVPDMEVHAALRFNVDGRERDEVDITYVFGKYVGRLTLNENEARELAKALREFRSCTRESLAIILSRVDEDTLEVAHPRDSVLSDRITVFALSKSGADWLAGLLETHFDKIASARKNNLSAGAIYGKYLRSEDNADRQRSAA